MISFSVAYDSVNNEIAKYNRYRRFAFAPGVKRMQYKCNKLVRIFITIGFFGKIHVSLETPFNHHLQG